MLDTNKPEPVYEDPRKGAFRLGFFIFAPLIILSSMMFFISAFDELVRKQSQYPLLIAWSASILAPVAVMVIGGLLLASLFLALTEEWTPILIALGLLLTGCGLLWLLELSSSAVGLDDALQTLLKLRLGNTIAAIEAHSKEAGFVVGLIFQAIMLAGLAVAVYLTVPRLLDWLERRGW